jgi:hypothetical protein
MTEIDHHKVMEKLTDIISNPMFAGVFGSLFSLKWVPGGTLSERLINLSAALTIVWYASPVVIDIFAIKTSPMAALMSFVIGLFGVNLTSQIFIGIKQIEFHTIFTGYLTMFADIFRKR